MEIKSTQERAGGPNGGANQKGERTVGHGYTHTKIKGKV